MHDKIAKALHWFLAVVVVAAVAIASVISAFLLRG
jgi:hypothetical protein